MRNNTTQWRPRWAASFLAVLLFLTAGWGAKAAEPARFVVEKVSHEGTLTRDGVRWTSHYYGDVVGDGRVNLDFATTLPATTALNGEPSDLEFIRDESGRVTGIAGLVQGIYHPLRLDLFVPERRWEPPLVATSTPQVVRLDGVVVDVDAIDGSPFEQRLGYLRHEGVTDAMKDNLEAMLPRGSDQTTIYLVADDAYLERGRLDTLLIPESERAARSWKLLLIITFCLVVAAGLVFALLRHQARNEEVEHFLSQHEGIP